MSPGELRTAYNQLLQRPGFTRDRGQERAVAKLDRLRESLIASPRDFDFWARRMLRLLPGRNEIEPVRGLYLWGGVGRGKTMLMDLFYERLPFAERERRHFHRFMHDVHDELRKLKLSTHPLEIVAHRLARRARVICFDEFQVADIADAMILGTLFAGLFRRGVTLVATANVPPADLYKDGLQRQRFVPAIGLIEKHVEVLHVEGGTDYRLRELRRCPIYFSADAPDTPERLEQLFVALAGEPGEAAGHAIVEHRRVRFVRRAQGVIWFDFHELCESARSQADYIEIARSHHTLFLVRVPVLDESDENAARRFIALIDELYDRNVNLVMSAAAAPAQLYRGKRLQFEFRRTASRLAEMQSEEYLARPHRA
jgi:cell division protein ZapE